jgi:hypothetical protein
MAQMSIQEKTRFFQNRDVAQAYANMMKERLPLLRRIQRRMQQASSRESEHRFYFLRDRVFYKSMIGEAWDHSPEIRHPIKPRSNPPAPPKNITSHEEAFNSLMAAQDADIDAFIRAGGNAKDALEMVQALSVSHREFSRHAKAAWKARQEEREAKLIQTGVITAETGFPIPTGWNSLRNPDYLAGFGNWGGGVGCELYYLREKLKARVEALATVKEGPQR